MKTESKWQISYFFVFVIRRQIYVAVAFLLISQPGWQIMGMLWLNQAWTLYLGQIQPHEMRLSNRIDLANEFLIMIIFFHLFFFTDWVPDQEA